jgi:hypothetical protein
MPVFFCYAHEDKTFVDKLARQLIERRAWVWVDRWELNVGDSIVERVQAAIENATAVIAVLSRASVNSPWVKRELQTIIYRQVEGETAPVVPVLIEDCPIPPFLQDRLYADFRTNFDQGLQTVLQAIASVTSATQARLETPDFHTDWAVDWGDVDGMAAMRLTLIDHSEKIRYCVLTQVSIIGNEAATQRYRVFAQRELEWVQHGVLINAVADHALARNLQVLLTDAREQRLTMLMGDLSGGIAYTFNITARWIGMDTGKDILLRLGDSIDRLRREWLQRVRPPTEAEQREIAALILGLRRS